MAATDLTQAEFGIAFAFSRSEARTYRDATGGEQIAPVNVPRFDHDALGAARGLLLTPGLDIGTQDRIALDPLLLPEALVDGPLPADLEATIFHAFVPLASAAWTVERRAYYTRNAKVSIDGLLAQAGHHLEIGVVAGFRTNLGGYVRLRGEIWTLPTLVQGNASGAVLAVDAAAAKPIIVAGAEVI